MKSIRRLVIVLLIIVSTYASGISKPVRASEGELLEAIVERCSGHVRVISTNPGSVSSPGFTITRNPSNLETWTEWSPVMPKSSAGQVKWYCWPHTSSGFAANPTAEYTTCPAGTDHIKFKLGPSRRILLDCID